MKKGPLAKRYRQVAVPELFEQIAPTLLICKLEIVKLRGLTKQGYHVFLRRQVFSFMRLSVTTIPPIAPCENHPNLPVS
jgi:hypothetical protein